ncbi:MAG: polysaccharide biosynthesis tyrosine autokinase [Polyangiaceae bacterium]
MALERNHPSPAATATELSVAGVVSVFKAVRKHWAIVVACVVLGGGGSLLYSKSIRKVYESSSLLEIDPRANQPLKEGAEALDLGTALFGDITGYYQTQYKIISSIPVMRAAVEALSLQNDYRFLGLEAPPPQPMTLEQAAVVLQSRVFVEPIKNSRLVYIRVSDFDPKRAKQLCDAVANGYIDLNLQSAISASSDSVVWLNSQIDHLKSELEHDENALYRFKEENSLPSISINDASNMLRLEMQEYDTVLAHTRTRKAELSARLAELTKATTESPDVIPASELLTNNFLQGLRGQYRQAADQRSALLASGKGENHPQVKEATDRMQEAQAALLREVGNIQAAVERDLAIVEREEQGEATLFNEARQRALDLNMKEIEYHRLDRTRDENEKLYSLLLARMKETDLARMMRVNNIRVVEPAAVPGRPDKPRVFVNLTLGLVGGFLVGFLLAWLREQLDSTIKTPDDIETKLNLTFLGLLPALDETDGGEKKSRRRSRRAARAEGVVPGPPELVVHRRPSSGISEAARSIRTNLMFMNPDKPYRTLLVTSAAPAEGKTTVACSIAIAFAQGGQRVCLVDCDLRRPRIHRIFDRAGDAGVTSVLVGDATVEDVAKATPIPNLWAIPAGPLPPNPADILHSERFRNFLRELGERFDRVVIDSPPLIAVTDSAIVSTQVDAVVFVVRAFKTGKYLGAQGMRALRDVEAPVVGAVLNAVNLDHHEYSYYYYFYYKRDGYYRDTATAARANDATDAPAGPPN